MGFAKSFIRYLIKEHKREAFIGKFLILGRQHVFITYKEFLRMISDEGLDPHALPEKISPDTKMPNWDFGKEKGFIDDNSLFQILAGAPAETLDISDYEGATYEEDLNYAVSTSLHDSFDLIIDGGTSEHVFNVASTVSNIYKMLRRGGRVVHITQASNWIEHGFYQFSPTFFYDFYGVNGFENMRCYLVVQGLGDITRNKWKWYKIKSNRKGPVFRSFNSVGIVFTGKKASESTEIKLPSQGMYTRTEMWKTIPGQSKRQYLFSKYVPSFLKELIRYYVLRNELWDKF